MFLIFQILSRTQTESTASGNKFFEATLRYVGTPYGNGPYANGRGTLNCVTLPAAALSDTLKTTGVSQKNSFPMNGGPIIGFSLGSGSGPSVISQSNIANLIPNKGDLLLAIRKATQQDFAHFYGSNDMAILYENGKVSVIESQKRAVELFKSGKPIYFTRHMLVADGDGGAVQASSMRNSMKVVQTDAEDLKKYLVSGLFDAYVSIPFSTLLKYVGVEGTGTKYSHDPHKEMHGALQKAKSDLEKGVPKDNVLLDFKKTASPIILSCKDRDRLLLEIKKSFLLGTLAINTNDTGMLGTLIAAENRKTGEGDERTLSMGSRGEQVKKMQEMLNAYVDAGLSADGEFGLRTYNALYAAQEKMGFTPDGICTGEIYKALEKLANETQNPVGKHGFSYCFVGHSWGIGLFSQHWTTPGSIAKNVNTEKDRISIKVEGSTSIGWATQTINNAGYKDRLVVVTGVNDYSNPNTAPYWENLFRAASKNSGHAYICNVPDYAPGSVNIKKMNATINKLSKEYENVTVIDIAKFMKDRGFDPNYLHPEDYNGTPVTYSDLRQFIYGEIRKTEKTF